MATADPNLFEPPLPEFPVAPMSDEDSTFDGIEPSDYVLWASDGTYVALADGLGGNLDGNLDPLSSAARDSAGELESYIGIPLFYDYDYLDSRVVANGIDAGYDWSHWLHWEDGGRLGGESSCSAPLRTIRSYPNNSPPKVATSDIPKRYVIRNSYCWS